MEDFLKENWIWIVAPVVIVALAVTAIVIFGESGEAVPFEYNIY